MSNYPPDSNLPSFPWDRLPPVPQRSPLADLLSNIQPAPRPQSWDSLFARLGTVVRPRIFVSYQHSTDQHYYNEFSRIFHDNYEVVYDNSLRGRIRSENPEYVIQRIREDYITGTCCTIVLIGPTTYERKYIDWEVKATLDKEHGLIGLQLPSVMPDANGQVLLPARLVANINSGYALWHELSWNQLANNPATLSQFVAAACARSKQLIVNPKDIKKQNG